MVGNRLYQERVLIVEDDLHYVEIYQQWLLDAGYISTAVSDVAQADTAIKYFDPNVVILDLHLSTDNNGEGFIIAKNALSREVPVVIVTRDPSYLNARMAFKTYKAVDFIPKNSLSKESLLETIDVAISSKVSREHLEEKTLHALSFITEVKNTGFDEFDTTTIQFFPDEETFAITKGSPEIGGFGMFKSPFSDNEDAILKLFDPNNANKNLSDKEKKGLAKLGYEIPLSQKNLKQIGNLLYKSLLNPLESSNTTSADLSSLLSKEHRGPQNLMFCFPENGSQLAKYPWELLHDGRRFQGQLKTNITRTIIYSELSSNLKFQWSNIRLLYVSSRPLGVTDLGDNEEKLILDKLDEFGLSDENVTTLNRPATKEKVASTLLKAKGEGKPFNILYFDGHGEYGWQCKKCDYLNASDEKTCQNPNCPSKFIEQILKPKPQTYLIFENDQKIPTPISQDDSVAIFGNVDLKLVILSSCYSNKVAETNIFNSVGIKILESDVPAILGMQFPVTTHITSKFFSSVFEQLSMRGEISSDSLMASVSSARRIIDKDWFCPVLYLRAQ